MAELTPQEAQDSPQEAPPRPRRVIASIDLEIAADGTASRVRVGNQELNVSRVTLTAQAGGLTLVTLDILRTPGEPPIRVRGRMVVDDPQEAEALILAVQKARYREEVYTDPAFDPETPIEEQLAEVTAAEQGE